MMMKYEIMKRLEDTDDTYQVIGAEIKQHRLAQSKTLASIADDDFSVSYLCKIERNQIRPSNKLLKEIFAKMDISEDKMDYLLSSRDMLINAVRSYYFKDLSLQKEYLEKLEGLDNHRIVLIRLIFALTTKNLDEASTCINKLIRLTSSLADLDLMIFSTFYGIYHFYLNNYLEASDYLKLALEYESEIRYLRPLQLGFLFICACKTFSINTAKYYLELEREVFKYGGSLKLDNAHYNMAIYYLILNQRDSFKKTIAKIEKYKTIKSLEMLLEIEKKNSDKIVDFKENDMDELTKAYFYIYHLSQRTIDYIDNLKLDLVLKDYLKYNYLKEIDLEAAYNFLQIAFEDSTRNLNGYLCFYFLEEIVNSIFRDNKYKHLTEKYNMCMNVFAMVNSI